MIEELMYGVTDIANSVAFENAPPENISTYESEKFIVKPHYEVKNVGSYQDDNGYHVDYTITNTGNAPSNSSDTMEVFFTGPYGSANDYTYEEAVWGKADMGGIGVGESKSSTIDLNVLTEPFETYGYVDCVLIDSDKDGAHVTPGDNIRLLASMPIEFMLNGEPIPDSIELEAGETMEFNISCLPQRLNNSMSAVFGTDDASVAAFDGTTLKAISEGTTVIHGNVTPYGSASVVTVPSDAVKYSRPTGVALEKS